MSTNKSKVKTAVATPKHIENKNSVAPTTITKVVIVNLVKTSYHYFRHYVKYILIEGNISKPIFKKNETGWHGVISVSKAELEKAKKILSDYKLKNIHIKDMWW